MELQWDGLDPELDAIFNDEEPDGPDLPRKKLPVGDVFEASRAGDVDRLRFLLELGVNVNARDAWDSVALYYACLAGHLDVATILLKNGAICSENTFDGDRCHYAALNLDVRKLLKEYEARPPPLSPLPGSLRELFLSSQVNLINLERSFGIPREDSASAVWPKDHHKPYAFHTSFGSNQGPDVTFFVSGRAMQAHRAILAARSPFFRKKFATDWRHRREFRFSSSKLSFSALFSLLHFFYTDRLDVAVDDMEDLVRICKVCKCPALQKSLEKEINHQRFASYKSLSDADDSKKRFILQGSSLPWESQLPAELRRLLLLSLRNSRSENRNVDQRLDARTCNSTDRIEENGQANESVKGDITAKIQKKHHSAASIVTHPNVLQQVFEEDHADVEFLVGGERFRCHTTILGTRSEYFKARFYRALENDYERPFYLMPEQSIQIVPSLKEHDLSAYTFKKLLEYIYTDILEEIDPDQAEEMFDAASRYLLFPLKRAVVDVLLPYIESTSPAELCHWLLMADMYEVSKLREHCLDAIALNFELFAATPEFRQMLQSLPPPSGEDATRTTAPSAPGGDGNVEQGNLLDDLREKWMAIEGEELDQRDESARKFDQRLKRLVEMAFEESESDFHKNSREVSNGTVHLSSHL